MQDSLCRSANAGFDGDTKREGEVVMIPIQVTEEGVLIPKTYLRNADEIEVIVKADYILVRPHGRPKPDAPSHAVREGRYSFIGIGETSNPTASTDVEAILEREADRGEGWSLKHDCAG